MSQAYSSVYGNKIRKLWKILAKNDMLTSTSYEFDNPQECKVKDCGFKVRFWTIYGMNKNNNSRLVLPWKYSDISEKTIWQKSRNSTSRLANLRNLTLRSHSEDLDPGLEQGWGSNLLLWFKNLHHQTPNNLAAVKFLSRKWMLPKKKHLLLLRKIQ